MLDVWQRIRLPAIFGKKLRRRRSRKNSLSFRSDTSLESSRSGSLKGYESSSFQQEPLSATLSSLYKKVEAIYSAEISPVLCMYQDGKTAIINLESGEWYLLTANDNAEDYVETVFPHYVPVAVVEVGGLTCIRIR